MSRDIPESLKQLFEASEVFPFFAIELFFDNDQTLRVWTGSGSLFVDTVEYFGTGSVLKVSDVEETAEIATSGATLSLSAVPEEVVSLALQEPYQGRRCKIYFGSIDRNNLTSSIQTEDLNFILTEDGQRIALEGLIVYSEIFSGYMDTLDIIDSGESSTLELKATNKLVDLERPRTARYTSAFQKFLYPGDKGFDFVESMQDKIVYWGRGS